MREIRPSGSAGGGTEINPSFLPRSRWDCLALGVPADPRRSTWPMLNDARSSMVAPLMPTSSRLTHVIRRVHCLATS
jgi:hypothetical protein